MSTSSRVLVVFFFFFHLPNGQPVAVLPADGQNVGTDGSRTDMTVDLMTLVYVSSESWAERFKC